MEKKQIRVSLCISSTKFNKMFPLFRFSKAPLNNMIFRMLSSSAVTTPLMLIGSTVKESFADRRKMADVVLFDPVKEKQFLVPDKTLPKELVDASLVGSSQGWGFFYQRLDGVLRISDYLNPFASKSNPKAIPLPPLLTMPNEEMQLVSNVAMSSTFPSEEEDCVVALKLLGNRISLCRQGRDLQWTHLKLPFTSLDNSNLFYSKTDQCFYLPSPGGKCLCSFNLQDNHKEMINIRELVFRDLPEFTQSELELFRSSSRAEHWVESSSGEHYLVQWFSYDFPLEKIGPKFIVFREEETMDNKYMCYTEDIEDLCIFLSTSHPFCVEASSCPGLEPNSIYIISIEDFGVYNLATKTFRDLEPPKGGPEGGPIMVNFVPFWIPPFSF